MHLIRLFALVGLLALPGFGPIACSQSDDVDTGTRHPVGAGEVAEHILARVNEAPITDLDLQRAIESTFGEQNAPRLTPDQKQKVLESLVMSKAIALVAKVELPPESLSSVEKRVQAFRDQLLVKQYLESYADPRPVTQEMIENYYDAHPETFGGKTIRSFEMLFGPSAISISGRDKLLQALNAGNRQNDWQKWSQQLRRKGHTVQYRQGQADDQVLASELRSLMGALAKGQTSNVSFIDGSAYLVRITDEVRIPPRPLREVSDQIRKALVPNQLKAAISQVSDDVLNIVEVNYETAIEGNN